ncbi:MAG: hypothetical protein AABX48_01330 [Nanoarchaeota archaeon]
MNLRYYIKNSKKIYTLNEITEGKQTQEAHYKFINLRDEPPSDARKVRKN